MELFFSLRKHQEENIDWNDDQQASNDHDLFQIGLQLIFHSFLLFGYCSRHFRQLLLMIILLALFGMDPVILKVFGEKNVNQLLEFLLLLFFPPSVKQSI